jgi:RNA polymerase sigma-70 factor (ECF subfamily)
MMGAASAISLSNRKARNKLMLHQTFIYDDAAAPPPDNATIVQTRLARPPHAIDDATFEEFYARTARPLWSYIHRVAGDRALADDLLQESFYRLWQAPRLLPSDDAQMKSYLYKIATNLINDHWRKINREKRWQLRASVHTEEVASPNDAALRSDVERVFQLLKLQERALLWLAYVECYEHREIASVLNLKEKSVRVLLFRARHKLAELLKEKGLDAKGIL